MVTYTLTFEQLRNSFALNSFGALRNLSNWYDSFSQVMESYRPDTHADWLRCGGYTRELHKAYFDLSQDLRFFLMCIENDSNLTAQITLTAKQLELLQGL